MRKYIALVRANEAIFRDYIFWFWSNLIKHSSNAFLGINRKNNTIITKIISNKKCFKRKIQNKRSLIILASKIQIMCCGCQNYSIFTQNIYSIFEMNENGKVHAFIGFGIWNKQNPLILINCLFYQRATATVYVDTFWYVWTKREGFLIDKTATCAFIPLSLNWKWYVSSVHRSPYRSKYRMINDCRRFLDKQY